MISGHTARSRRFFSVSPHSSRALASALVVTCVVLSIGLGVAATSEQSTKLLEILVGLIAIATLLWRFGLGGWLALLVLGSVDALPGPELETIEIQTLHLYASDFMIVLLIVTLLLDNSRNGFRYLANTKGRRILCVWSAGLLLVWSVTVARSNVAADIPLKHAMYFGRDFAFFALLLPLFAATLARRRVRNSLLLVLAFGVLLVDITEILSVATHNSLSFFVHSQRTTEIDGITRLYVDAQYIEVVAAALGTGLVLLSKVGRLRLLGAMLAIFSTAAVLVELTRAQYVGGVVGIVAALAVWLTFDRRTSWLGRLRIARFALIVVVLVGVIAVVQPPHVANSVLKGVESRFSSVFSTLSSSHASSSTVAYREIEASELERVLGSHWLFGLGFLDPRNHYVSGLPNGSIRNGDVGVLNAVMTMGVIGAVLIYFPVVYLLIALVSRAVSGAERSRESWIAFGIAAWIVSTLTSSVTLLSLFSAPGLCIAALALGIAATCAEPRLLAFDADADSDPLARRSRTKAGAFEVAPGRG
jgi:hypothetical protein